MNEESERKEQKERNRMSAQRSRHRKRVESDSLRQESNKVSVTCASIKKNLHMWYVYSTTL